MSHPPVLAQLMSHPPVLAQDEVLFEELTAAFIVLAFEERQRKMDTQQQVENERVQAQAMAQKNERVQAQAMAQKARCAQLVTIFHACDLSGRGRVPAEV